MKPLRKYAEYLRIKLETYYDGFEYNIYYSNLTQHVKTGEINGVIEKHSPRQIKIGTLNFYCKEIEALIRVPVMTFEEFYAQLKRDNKFNNIMRNE